MADQEVWKFHPRYPDRYAVSTFGRVALYRYEYEDKKKIFKDVVLINACGTDRYGNPMVFVEEQEQQRPIPIYILVLETHVGTLAIDGNPMNCKLENMRWRPKS